MLRNSTPLLFLLIFGCHGTDSPAAVSAPSEVTGAALEVGGLAFSRSAELLAHRILANGTELAPKPYHPFFLTRGYGPVHSDRLVADELVVVESLPGRAVVQLSSSSLPEVWILLRLEAAGDAVFFEVVAEHQPELDWLIDPPELGFDARFIVPLELECQLGYIGYTPGSHTCSFGQGTIGAFCLTGNCENRNQHTAPAVAFPVDPHVLGTRLGAALLPTPIKPLSGGRFALLHSGHPIKSLAYLAEFKSFKESLGSTAEAGPSLFLVSPPFVFGCSNDAFCPESAARAAQIARDLGFEELQLESHTWLAKVGPAQRPSFGVFDPGPRINEVLRAIKNEGVCPMLHTLPSFLTPENPLCSGDPACPAALRGPDGQIRTEGPWWLSDMNRRRIQDELIASHVDGIEAYGACGMYADGAELFHSNGYATSTWIEELAKRSPTLRLRPNYTLANAALYLQEFDFQDVWQVLLAKSPRDWALGFGYFSLQGLLEGSGLRGRLGWVPPPVAEDTPEDYQMLLNTAVATGAHPTIETRGDDPAFTTRWFVQAMRETNAAVREIRANGALGFYAGGDARHDLYHFDSGVSTVALFDGIIPAAPRTQLEARSFGVLTEESTKCGPFQSCFYFSGADRMPFDYNLPKLRERGSYIFHPPHPKTRSADFTISAWFHPEPGAPRSGSIFEKGLFGYGLNYWEGQFSGHFNGSGPGQVFGIYRELPDSRRPGWHHVAFAYDNAAHRFDLFIDGALVESTFSALSANVYASTPIYVGTNGPDRGGNFSGWINDVRLYTRAVGREEMRDIYRSALGVPEPEHPAPLLSWSAGQVAPELPIVDVALDAQRVAYLVPLIEGAALPEETVRLHFGGFRSVDRVQIEAPVPVIITRNPLSREVVVEVRTADLGIVPVRIAVTEGAR